MTGMRGATRLRGRLLVGMAAVAAVVLVWGVAPTDTLTLAIAITVSVAHSDPDVWVRGGGQP